MKTTQTMDLLQIQMQESRMKMHEQLHKIIYARNPQEQALFQQEHRSMMQLHIQARKASGLIG